MAKKPFHETIAAAFESRTNILLRAQNGALKNETKARIYELSDLVSITKITNGYQQEVRDRLQNCVLKLRDNYPGTAQRIEMAANCIEKDSISNLPSQESRRATSRDLCGNEPTGLAEETIRANVLQARLDDDSEMVIDDDLRNSC